jgi:hypothetical protein
MLESASERLMQSGMPHHNCPDKVLRVHVLKVLMVTSTAAWPNPALHLSPPKPRLCPAGSCQQRDWPRLRRQAGHEYPSHLAS